MFSDTWFVALSIRGGYLIYATCFELLKLGPVFSLRRYTFSISYICPSIFYSSIVILFAGPDELSKTTVGQSSLSLRKMYPSFLFS